APTAARLRIVPQSPIGSWRKPPPRAENAANFFRSSARAVIKIAKELLSLEIPIGDEENGPPQRLHRGTRPLGELDQRLAWGARQGSSYDALASPARSVWSA